MTRPTTQNKITGCQQYDHAADQLFLRKADTILDQIGKTILIRIIMQTILTCVRLRALESPDLCCVITVFVIKFNDFKKLNCRNKEICADIPQIVIYYYSFSRGVFCSTCKYSNIFKSVFLIHGCLIIILCCLLYCIVGRRKYSLSSSWETSSHERGGGWFLVINRCESVTAPCLLTLGFPSLGVSPRSLTFHSILLGHALEIFSLVYLQWNTVKTSTSDG